MFNQINFKTKIFVKQPVNYIIQQIEFSQVLNNTDFMVIEFQYVGESNNLDEG